MNATQTLVDALDAVLPQTQCAQCGHAGCRPYAEAMASAAAPINQCPPGGDELIRELAAILSVEIIPLNTVHGIAMPPATAIIDESTCIGCTLCLDACPVDAIVGARKLMHTVIKAECTGCELCLPPCPVDCIAIVATGMPRDRTAQRIAAEQLQERYHAHLQRQTLRNRKQRSRNDSIRTDPATRKHATIQRALARAQARLSKN